MTLVSDVAERQGTAPGEVRRIGWTGRGQPAARPSKFTNAQTILYEIDMLKFTATEFYKSDDEWSAGRKLE
jgi:hypothetical protein